MMTGCYNEPAYEYSNDVIKNTEGAKSWDQSPATETWKYSTIKLVTFQQAANTCWNSSLTNSAADYLVNHFCVPTLAREMVDTAAK
jgi:hypothetical protein